VEDIDTGQRVALDRALFLKLAGCDWIREHRHCLMTGPLRVGSRGWLAPSLQGVRENLSSSTSASPRCFACWHWDVVTVATPS